MDTAPSTTHAKRLLGVLALAVVLDVALVVYRPWIAYPFDILDFSEFVPLLREADGLGGRFVALVDYYAGQHGRFNVVSYAALALKWTLFGEQTLYWQWARFLQMGLIVAGVYWLLRRLNIAVAGAVAGATLFVAADAAMEGWIRLTMGEPLGMVLTLAAAILACDYRRAPGWRWRALAVTALLAGALLAKEMLIGLVPFVLALAVVYQGDGRFRRPAWDGRTRWFVVVSVIGLGATAAVIGLVALGAPAEGFTVLYGDAGPSPSRFARIFGRMSLPAQTYLRGWRALTATPNLLYAVLLTGGLILALRQRGPRRRVLGFVAVAAALPATGAVLYLPWPQYHAFYGLPYLLGSALLLGLAVDALMRHAPRVRWAVALAVVSLLAITGSIAQQVSGRTGATRIVNADLARVLLEPPAVDSFLVVVGGRADQDWQGTAATLGRYAGLLQPGAMVPSGIEVTCAESDGADGAVGGPVLVLVHFGSCPVDGIVVARPLARYRFASWRDLTVVTDSVWAEAVLLPNVAGPDVIPAAD